MTIKYYIGTREVDQIEYKLYMKYWDLQLEFKI